MKKNTIREKSLLSIRSTEWNCLLRMKVAALLAVGLLATPITASSAMVGPLTFDEGVGVGDFNPVGSFYNGGGGGSLGIVFSSNALGLVDNGATPSGSGAFGNAPSPDTIMFFATGSSVIVDYAAGFTSAFSFYYAALTNPGSVSIYDGVGGAGNLLGSQNFSAQDQSGCSPDALCVWSLVNVMFPIGTAKSIVLGGTAESIGFDNLSFGSDPAPVPLPAAAWLLLSGLAGLGFVGRRRTT